MSEKLSRLSASMFNPHARWDRPLPRDNVLPGEEIEAAAVFTRGKILPLWFNFCGERHIVKKIFFVWKERKGGEEFCLYSVSDKDGCKYRLCLSRQKLLWRLLNDE